jgi:ubiquinone/menaquinone biosynthesis C-methylase UbiE
VRRETVNRIRYVLEEWLPPWLRDSSFMRWLFRLHWGRFVDELEQFRRDITTLSPQAYKSVYERMPRIQDETDNSQACLNAIAGRVSSGKAVDVGCGTGYLLNFLRQQSRLNDVELFGVDFIIEPDTERRHPSIRFVAAPVEALPFADRHFDTVICTHVLEHVLDIRSAIAELRRICSRRLVIVVPLEREYRFTFNAHIHFFPYPHSFLRHIQPVPRTYETLEIGRDLLYVEEVQAP